MNESDHLTMLRETLRRFVQVEMPHEAAARWDVENTFPRPVFDALADLGVMGLTIPEEFGGTGRDIVATMAVIEELFKRSLSVLGAYGYVAGFAMERYVRDILLMPIIGGSSAIQRNNIVNRQRLPR